MMERKQKFETDGKYQEKKKQILKPGTNKKNGQYKNRIYNILLTLQTW